MDIVHRCVAPLSPFTWDAEDSDPSASIANAVLHDISLLDLRFDLILDEFAIPCHHTICGINGGFPLKRKNLTLRQLQLLQYGVVVHAATRLVIVAAPPCCGDSGACLAASYERLFNRSLNAASAVAHHPLLPEYTFIVYRLPATVHGGEMGSQEQHPQHPQQRPEALFRLVYRNVNPNSAPTGTTVAGDDFDITAAPEYKLVAVLVSSTCYYDELQRVSQYRREWYAHSAANRASGVGAMTVAAAASTSTSTFTLATSEALHPLPEQVAAEVRRASSLSGLCTCFAHVLERFTAIEESAVTDENDAEETATTVTAAAAATAASVPDRGNSVKPEEAEEEEEAAMEGRSCSDVAGKYGGRCRRAHRGAGSDPWSYQYTRDGARLISRLVVMERTKAALQSWRDGAFDLAETVVTRAEQPSGQASAVILGAHSTHPPFSIQRRRALCARLLLVPTRQAVATHISANEIVSFLPSDESSKAEGGAESALLPAVAYASPAAERLRRWILQGLAAAEVHGIHAVFLDLDPVSALLPCVELLAETAVPAAGDDSKAPVTSSQTADAKAVGAAEDEAEPANTAQLRYKRALLLVCQVTMETVERFVRHSGLVWRVTVAVREATAAAADKATPAPGAETSSFTAWCSGMLALLREAAVQRENTARYNTLSFADDSDDESEKADGGGRSSDAAALVAVSSSQNGLVRAGGSRVQGSLTASQQLVFRTEEMVEGAVALYRHEASGPAVPLAPHIVSKAKAVGVKVGEADMYALFQVFCAAANRRDQRLPVPALVDVLTDEWSTETARRRSDTSTPTRLVCPLDSCGVPVTRARVQRFLQPFLDVMRDSPLGYSGGALGGAQSTSPQTLNYAQFSLVMFAIAKM